MKKVSMNLAGGLSLLGVIGAVAASPAFAETGVSQISQAVSNDPVAQNVTSVSQLSDVRPTDWAFTALQSLVERYGCIAGYPDSTYRGNQATSRYEFAAGLNACLDKINEIISAGLADKVSQEDLATLQRLQEEFAAELATLRGRVDALDAKTAKLEAQQFSTTTKLSGEAIMSVQGGSGNNFNGTNSTNIFVSSRVRLDLNTSFTGSDLLKTRLEVGNGAGGSVPGAFGALAGPGPLGNTNIGFDTYGQDYTGLPSTFTLAKLRYDFNVGDQVRVSLGPVMHAYDHIDTNSFANNEAVDFASTFFINNPLQILINGQTGGAGAFVDWNVNKSPFSIRALYLAGNGNSPTGVAAGNATVGNLGAINTGLFGDPYQGTVELEYAPKTAEGSKPFALKLQYTGGSVDNVDIKSGGVNVEWAFSKSIAAFGRYGFGTIDATRLAVANGLVNAGAKTDVQTWMFGLAFPDLFKEGATGSVAVGQPLIVSGGGSSQTNLELFYNFPVTSNIRITPDVQFIFNPNNSTSSTIFVGTLRTVFTF